jgi:hypothetical protein
LTCRFPYSLPLDHSDVFKLRHTHISFFIPRTKSVNCLRFPYLARFRKGTLRFSVLLGHAEGSINANFQPIIRNVVTANMPQKCPSQHPHSSSLSITCETIRANYAYYAFHAYPQISASVVALLSEIFKLLIAAFLLKSNNDFSMSALPKYLESAQNGDIHFKKMLKYALPASLYLMNKLIYYTVLPLRTPSLLQVCVLAKLPTTGILHHYMIKQQHNIIGWISLLFLCIGLAVFNIPSTNQESNEAVAGWYLTPMAGFVIACLSALASISMDSRRLRRRKGSSGSRRRIFIPGRLFSRRLHIHWRHLEDIPIPTQIVPRRSTLLQRLWVWWSQLQVLVLWLL